MRHVLRSVLLALLLSLLAGFALGTCLRQRAERPTLYIGDSRGRSSSATLWTAVHGPPA